MAFETLFAIAWLVFISGLLAAVYGYIRLRRDRSHGAVPSFVRYFVLAGLFAFAAYMAGTVVGIAGGCSVRNAGNLCGIWGALAVGPLLSGTALWVYGPLWRRRLPK